MQSKNNTVLLIAPEFYHYHTSIIDSLSRNGKNVIFFPELPNGFLYRIAKNFAPEFYFYLLEQYFKKIIISLKDKTIDTFLTIRGESMPEWFVLEIRRNNPNAKFVMYQWDSNKNNKFDHLINLFDKVSTFDPEDALNFNIEYFPLFYIERGNSICNVKDIDFLFVGSLHGNRLQILKDFKATLPQKTEVYFHVYLSFFSYIKLLVKGVKIDLADCSFRKVAPDKLNSLIKKSINVIDLCSESQTGITVRSFEALSSRCRLITNNPSIVNLLPMISENIDIVYDNKFVFKNQYLQELSSSIDLSIMRKYELDHWLIRLINGSYAELSDGD